MSFRRLEIQEFRAFMAAKAPLGHFGIWQGFSLQPPNDFIKQNLFLLNSTSFVSVKMLFFLSALDKAAEKE